MNRTLTTLYRVVSTTTTGFTKPLVSTDIIWQGSDTDELSRHYPPSDILFADPLGIQPEIEDGLIRTHIHFERQLADGSWTPTTDPRRRLTPITATERAIDAENRRDFPGDFDTEDDDDHDWPEPSCKHCDDHGCDICNPPQCTDCSDAGCASCDPHSVCSFCRIYDQYFVVNGICQGCEYELGLIFCITCRQELPDGNPDAPCVYCNLPICGDCQYYPPDGDDNLCSDCRNSRAPRCFDCMQPLIDPTTAEDDICQECLQDWARYDVWWRRTLRNAKYWWTLRLRTITSRFRD